MKQLPLVLSVICIFSACLEKKADTRNDFVISTGQMPAIAKDSKGNLQLVFGLGDSIMYACSADMGKSFSSASLIAVLPKLAASHMRGPQIAATEKGLTVIACNSLGDIFSYINTGSDKWMPTGKVNDVDTVVKENLIALGADNGIVFATWLDLRGNGQNKIYGAASYNGGKTWAKNLMIYTSPDTTVCQCCKPSVAVNGNNVFVMFRNWLNGSRDMYMVESKDGGNSFGQAQKLGRGSWKLNGCPMDGGSLAINKKGELQTVWRREGKVYSAVPGMPESEIGEGRGCTVESFNLKNIYAWTENGEIVIVKPQGQKKILGKGSQPVVKALNNEKGICVWENEKQIHAAVFEL